MLSQCELEAFKPGDQVLVRLMQDPLQAYPGVVSLPVRWHDSRKEIGTIGIRVAFHADNPRWVLVSPGAGLNKGFDEVSPVEVED